MLAGHSDILHTRKHNETEKCAINPMPECPAWFVSLWSDVDAQFVRVRFYRCMCDGGGRGCQSPPIVCALHRREPACDNGPDEFRPSRVLAHRDPVVMIIVRLV